MANIKDSLDMIATTLDAWSKDSVNAIINKNGALYYFKTFGKAGLQGKNDEPMGSIETLDGGKRISCDLLITENPNVGFVAYDETIGDTVQDSMATAYYDWKFCYGNAPVYKAQIDLNSGKFAKRKLVMSIVEVAETTMYNSVGTGLWNTTDADGLVGFPALFSDDGTTTTVGELSTVTYANWKNQFENVVVTPTTEQLRTGMNSLYRKCKFGQDSIDLILVGDALYGQIENFMTINERYQRSGTAKKMADTGFETLSYKGATILYDENCPDNRAYFVNTKATNFYVHPKDSFKVGEMEKYNGQFKFNFPLSATLALITKNRKMNGVLVVAAA